MNGINLVLLLTLTNQTAVQAARIVLPLYLLDLDAGPATIGLMAGTFSLFPALLAVAMGRLVDRRGSRLPLLVASCVGVAGMLVPFFFRGVPWVFAGATAVSLATACLNVTLQNLVGVLSTPENRPRNFANFSLCTSTCSFIGPVLGGFCIDQFGYGVTCAVVAFFFLPSVVVLATSRNPALSRVSRHAGHKKGRTLDLLTGPGIARTLVASSMQSVGDILYSYYMPVYCHSIGLSASVIGMILGANAIAAFVVRLALPRLIRQLGEHGLLAAAFVLSGLAMGPMPFFTSAWLLGLLSFLLGAGMGCTGPTVNMLMFANSPPGRSAEALGMKVTINHGTKVVSPIILGYVIAATSLAPVFWATACLFGIGAWSAAPRAVKKPT